LEAQLEPERQTVSIPEFGRILGVGRNSAYKAVQRGEVRAIKIGGRMVIPRKEVERLLNGEILATEATRA
jgi:excisionase family DNA binding protein